MALDIDVFHFDPQTTLDPLLGSYQLDLDIGREAALRRLREAFGEPIALTREGLQSKRDSASSFTTRRGGPTW